jgi:hypothetical protein
MPVDFGRRILFFSFSSIWKQKVFEETGRLQRGLHQDLHYSVVVKHRSAGSLRVPAKEADGDGSQTNEFNAFGMSKDGALWHSDVNCFRKMI